MKSSRVMLAVFLFLSSVNAAIPDDNMQVDQIEAGAFTASYLVKRKEGMSFEAFKAYQLETHVPLALALPGLKDYKLTFFPPNDSEPQVFDAMAQVTFDSSAAHDAALAAEPGQKALADLANFLDTAATRVLAAGPGDVYTGHPSGK